MTLLLWSAGVVLVLTALTDIFITVLYARSDLRFVSAWLGRAVWAGFRIMTLRLPRRVRDPLLTMAGPSLLVLIVLAWVGLMWVGFALVYWPMLGQAIVRSSGETSTGFVTALYYSGTTLSTLGYGDIVPRTAGMRIVGIAQAALGFSVLTLSLTYLLSVYSALIRRNTLVLALHHRSAGTDDAVELLRRLCPGGHVDGAHEAISQLNWALHDLFESHHSYPVLHYFHFRDSFYATSHIVAMLADLAAMAATALDTEHTKGLPDSAAISEAEHGTAGFLECLGPALLPRGFEPSPHHTRGDEDAWREHFRAACDRLAESGIPVTGDRTGGEERYVALRRRWNGWVSAFAQYLIGAAK